MIEENVGPFEIRLQLVRLFEDAAYDGDYTSAIWKRFQDLLDQFEIAIAEETRLRQKGVIF
jgi:hypothetical protein